MSPFSSMMFLYPACSYLRCNSPDYTPVRGGIPGTAGTASAVPLFHQSNNLFSIYSLVCYYPEYSRLNMPI